MPINVRKCDGPQQSGQARKEQVNDDAIRVLYSLHTEVTIFLEVESGSVLPGNFRNKEEGTDFCWALINGEAFGLG